MQKFREKQAVLVVVFKAKAVHNSFKSQYNVMNLSLIYIQHNKTLFFDLITSNLAIIRKNIFACLFRFRNTISLHVIKKYV